MPDPTGAGVPAGGRARRHLPAVSVGAGVMLLLVAAGVWWAARPAPDFGNAATRALATGAGATGAPELPAPSGADSGALGAVPTRPATLPTAADPVVAPIRLVIPTLRLTARIIPVGVAADGQFDVPPSVDTVGWYRDGPGLDAVAGSIAVAGHVDFAGQGPGAFFELRRLRPGDRIEVAGSDGRTAGWRIVARQEYPKSAIDLNRYITSTGALRLTLLTCGGSFDERTRHYRDNVVVTAVPW